jgi:hypothetical protein
MYGKSGGNGDEAVKVKHINYSLRTVDFGMVGVQNTAWISQPHHVVD